MSRRTLAVAMCGMGTALSVVLMFFGCFLQIGTYLVPMIAGLLMVPAKREFGVKYAMTMWAAVSILSLFLLSDKELAMFYAGLFGWYPAAKMAFDRRREPARTLLKLAAFNASVIAIYALLLWVIAPGLDMDGPVMTGILLVVGNITFVFYDRFLTGFTRMYEKKWRARWRNRG